MIGQYFAVYWKGRGKNQIVKVGPNKSSIDEVRAWLKSEGAKRYVIKQHVEKCDVFKDGYMYIENTI